MLAFAVVVLLFIVFLLVFKKATPPTPPSPTPAERVPCRLLEEDPIYLQRVEAQMIKELREEEERREENIYSECP